jgi:hypothetical protein
VIGREASSGEQAAYISLQEATITLNGAQEHMAEVKNALAAEAHKFQAWQVRSLRFLLPITTGITTVTNGGRTCLRPPCAGFWLRSDMLSFRRAGVM